MDCPNCGKQNSGDSTLCSSCGWVLRWQTPVRNDVGDGNWCSMTPFICSIVPIVLAVGLIGLVGLISPDILRPKSWGCFGGLVYGPILLCVAFLIALVMMPLGVISVVSGIAALKEPEARGKPLVVVAIGLGILEIATVTGCFVLFILPVLLRLG